MTPEEAAETARVARDKPHAPADATAREKAVRDLFDVIEEGPPIGMATEQDCAPLSTEISTQGHPSDGSEQAQGHAGSG